jgi:hypothetical protein
MSDSSEQATGCIIIIATILFLYFLPSFLFNDSIDAVQELEYGEFTQLVGGNRLFGNIDYDEEIEDILDDNEKIIKGDFTKYSVTEYSKLSLNDYSIINKLIARAELEEEDPDDYFEFVRLSLNGKNSNNENVSQIYDFLVLKGSIWQTLKSFASTNDLLSSALFGGPRPWAQVMALANAAEKKTPAPKK